MNEEDRKEQIQRVDNARKELGLKPGDMARAMGVGYSTYKKWASGANPMPPVALRCLVLLRLNPTIARQVCIGE